MSDSSKPQLCQRSSNPTFSSQLYSCSEDDKDKKENWRMSQNRTTRSASTSWRRPADNKSDSEQCRRGSSSVSWRTCSSSVNSSFGWRKKSSKKKEDSEHNDDCRADGIDSQVFDDKKSREKNDTYCTINWMRQADSFHNGPKDPAQIFGSYYKNGDTGGESQRKLSKFGFLSGQNKDEQHSNNAKSSDQPVSAKRTRIFGYRLLQSLVTKEADEIIPVLLNSSSGFKDMLNSLSNADCLYLLMPIIRTVCLSELSGSRTCVLSTVCESDILHYLSAYIGDMSIEHDDSRIESMAEFVDSVVTFFDTVVHTIPSTAANCNFNVLISKLSVVVSNIKDILKVTVENAVLQKLEKLKDIMCHWDELKDQLKTKNNASLLRTAVLAKQDAPNLFRWMNLYPEHDDLHRGCMGFVRPNIIQGAYNDLEHYLDIQLRLLREDYMSPLREGIQEYIGTYARDDRKHKFGNVRIYKEVKFMHTAASGTRMGYYVNFDPNNKMKHIDWNQSKLFMYGSLLLFTVDEFNTFFLCTVLDRSKLNTGVVAVVPVGSSEYDDYSDGFDKEDWEGLNGNTFNLSYTMAQSDVYFEPYLLVMRALCNRYEWNFPFLRYIVDADTTARLPHHVLQNPKWVIKDQRFDLNGSEWPSADNFALDYHQYEAFKHALTREFSIIQGPPGTGKTYISLMITKTIVQNLEELPVLVVCYTNHALDQFLEECLKFTDRIVRIGGQSKSQKLHKYTVENLIDENNKNNIREEYRSERIRHTIGKACADLDLLKFKINRNEMDCERIEMDGIISLDHLEPFMSRTHSYNIKSDQDFVSLLLDDDQIMFNNPIFFKKCSSDIQKLLDESNILGNISDYREKENVNEVQSLIDDFTQLGLVFKDTTNGLRHSINVEVLDNNISFLRNQFEKLKFYLQSEYSVFAHNRMHELHQLIICGEYVLDATRRNMRSAQDVNQKNINTLKCTDFRNLNIQERWCIYYDMVENLRQSIQNKIKLSKAQFRHQKNRYDEMQQIKKSVLLRLANTCIVGMTTTGAARLQTMLRSLSPAVVIVEEAAEVLEAHVVVTLTKECKHLILIGDHKQLRPSSAVYELSKRFNIDVSLFERMINNGMYCPTLNVQHRMRPEISEIIMPFIYPGITNAFETNEYKSVRGISKNIYFLDHQHHETEVQDSSSRKNVYEAEFAISLCKYILRHKYKPENVTILTTYTGQMFYLRELQRTQGVPGEVKITVVDKYQGEENDIVILSLVRSNHENRIGFLKIDNRICVALTRAKMGLYIIGNMSLMSLNSKLWTNIKEVLQEKEAIGSELILNCLVHNQQFAVSSKHDFLKAVCHEICNVELECGHYCRKSCNVCFQQHDDVCREQCSKTCVYGHPCENYCGKECGPCMMKVERTLACGHKESMRCHINSRDYKCTAMVEVVLPKCSHVVIKNCQSIDDVCDVPCGRRLDCGHHCTRNCHVDDDPYHLMYVCENRCEKKNERCLKNHQCAKLCWEDCGKCIVSEKMKLPCGHEQYLRCGTEVTTVLCNEICNKICVSCGLPCKELCHEDCFPCENIVKKVIPSCGHEIETRCADIPDATLCTANCKRLKYPCLHPCMSECGTPCYVDRCNISVSSKIQMECDHIKSNVPCYMNEQNVIDPKAMIELMKSCEEPCSSLLVCGHVCEGTCSVCFQGKYHKTCNRKCERTKICGHTCKFRCGEICPPCLEPCNYSCMHGKCNKICGEPCVRCKKPCPVQCPHQSCTKKCWEMCDRLPCSEPCEKLLPCGHQCLGFCGETCPPLCRVCNTADVVALDRSEEKLGRFVYLEDCKHTIQSQELENYMSLSRKDEITMNVCPVCKTPITKTRRYMNHVKKMFTHIININKCVHGDQKKSKKIYGDIVPKLEVLKNRKFLFHKLRWDIIARYIDRIFDIVKKKRANVVLCMSDHQLTTIAYYVELFEKISLRADDYGKIASGRRFPIDQCMNLMLDRIANARDIGFQLDEDIYREVGRFDRLLDLALISNDCSSPLLHEAQKLLEGPTRFTAEKNDQVVQLMNEVRISDVQPREVKQTRTMSRSFFDDVNTCFWFICSNGHYFANREDDGVNIECPKCKWRPGK